MHPPAAADTGCGAHQRKEKNVPTAALNWTHIFRLSFKRHVFSIQNTSITLLIVTPVQEDEILYLYL